MMYCNSCGKQIADGAVLCPYCGMSARQDDTLAELVAAARIGDQDAISALYEKTYSKVYYTVKSMIKDEDAVFDIVQDTYIKAFDHLDSFQGDTKFLPWIRQIAANTARDWLKKKRPMLFTELGSGDGQDTPVEELFPDERSENLPDQVIDQQETKRLIREILEKLPEDQRAAIGMYYYEEMSVKEIAAAMGVSESAVKSRLMYGRDKIEKKVLELEKQGTKLYSLSPIPFLLLLFRNQAAYAAEVPDSRILHAILASQPKGGATAAGAAQGAGTAGGAASSEAAGATAAGTAAAAGGIDALKTGLIALAVVAVVGIGAFVATRIASNSAEPQEVSTIEDVNNQEETESPSDESGTQDPAEEDLQLAEGAEGSEGEDSQFAEEAEEEEEEGPIFYIFSHMPIAAYEVTGLGVGRFESVWEEEIFVEYEGGEGGFYFNDPFIRLTPGENTFVIFCIPGDVELTLYENGGFSTKGAAIHSPSESGQWEAITYKCSDGYIPELEGFSKLLRRETDAYAYDEETREGRIRSIIDPVQAWIQFAEIYHPDAPQNDAIYVIEAYGYPDAQADFLKLDGILAHLATTFEDLGATSVREIPVEKALKRCHASVAEGDAD